MQRLALLLAAFAGAVCLQAGLTASAEEKPKPSAPASAADDAQHARQMAQGLALFKLHVRPVLIGRCVKCHGGETTESEFDLTSRQSLLKGGSEGPVIVPGKGKQGRLYKLITHAAKPNMPEDGAKLSGADIAHIAEWIDLGAPYDRSLNLKEDDPLAWTRNTIDESRRQFWSFQPLAEVEPPALENDSWSRTPIDPFVLSKLREKSIEPNSPADRRTLIRRAYFDLIGLPPSADEVRRFVSDPDPRAYDKLIDRLLESPHYGERWGRHWLDVARFAESHGFEQDYDRPYAYHFRDFVIRALNQDMPYDRFVRWQLAGDELAPKDPLAMMATGFLGAGVFPTQITANEVERTRYDALDDMAATLGTAMLGLTVGCARCHDHKYDPIPQSDYYRLIATFTTTVRSNVELNMDPEGYRRAKAEFDREHAPLAKALADYEQGKLSTAFDAWLAGDMIAERKLLGKSQWYVLDRVEAKSEGGATIEQLDDASLLASGKNPDNDTYTITAETTLSQLRALRLEALPHDSLTKKGPGRASNGNFALSRIEAAVSTLDALKKKATPLRLKLVAPRADFQQNGGNLAVAAALDDDPKTGWAVDPQFGRRHAAVFAIDEESRPAIEPDTPVQLTVKLFFTTNKQHALGHFRLSLSGRDGEVPFDAPEAADRLRDALRATLAGSTKNDSPKPASGKSISSAQRKVLLDYFKQQDARWRELHGRVAEHLAQAPQPKMETVMVASEGVKPIRHHTQGADFFEQTYFLRRGDCDQKSGVAESGFLQAVTNPEYGAEHWREQPPEDWRTSYRRRALAHWITDTTDGPGQLLARVIVNRLWHLHFGRGIVATPNDFGAQGARPTHSELLDWLAGELIRGGWKLKPIHKLIMTSAAYTQSSEYRDDASRADPENMLLWRFPPRRLEAEIIRDAMLAVSGQLDERMYGPGTLDEGHKRRSIYFMVKRSKLVPMMQLFDAPEPLVSVGRRPSTTIAPQALMFMNNVHVRGYARAFARRLLSEEVEAVGDKNAVPKWERLVRRGYAAAVGRDPTDGELADNVAFLKQQSAAYAKDGKSDSVEFALADFCQVLMSLNEFVYVQ